MWASLCQQLYELYRIKELTAFMSRILKKVFMSSSTSMTSAVILTFLI
jgi:hypothetical protein